MDRVAATRLLWAAVMLGCGPAVSAAGASAGASAGGSDTSSSAGDVEGASSSSDTGSTVTTDDFHDEASTGTSEGSESSTGVGGGSTSGNSCKQVICDGVLHDCGDGIDNDGDGRVDLDDPHCTSPCHDNEAAFDDAHPGDDLDCRRDCYFDGNSGAGDDGCRYDVACDPLSPGDAIGCGFHDAPSCDDYPVPGAQPDECRDFCQPFVPPGCDCFGCCEVQTSAGLEHILLLGSPEDCSPDDLDSCPRCTSSMEECGNSCDECELCFGRTELPDSCETNTCDNGLPCSDPCDCPDGGYCLLGCCYPAPF